MVQFDQEVVIVDGAVHAQVLRRQAEDVNLGAVDGVDIGQNCRVVIRGFAVALAFVVTEEKCLVLYTRASQRSTELVLTQFIEPARCSQSIFRIHGIVAEIFV